MVNEQVEAFCEASIRGDMRRAARLLDETPAISDSFPAALLLGLAERVARELQADPSLAVRPDPRSGWTPLHATCSSRWHQVDPAREEGLGAVARLLLDAGADPTGRGAGRRMDWTPLRCAIAVSNSGPSNRGIVELLLARGAVPGDHDLYLAGFAYDRHQLLPLLLAHVPNPGEIAERALAAPIGNLDAESARLLLDAGADPRRYRDDDGHTASVAWAAVEAGCGSDLLELLLSHGADPDAIGADGRTPYRLATANGRTDLAGILRRYGAGDTTTGIDRFLSACRRADRARAEDELAADPGLLDRMTDGDRKTIARAAAAGDTAAVSLMLDLGFSLDTSGEHGGTLLHEAAFSGSADVVRLLLDRGAVLEARDSGWNDTALGWAAVGSGEKPQTNVAADWLETVRILLERGASTAGITLAPDDPKPPSPEVAELLRA